MINAIPRLVALKILKLRVYIWVFLICLVTFNFLFNLYSHKGTGAVVCLCHFSWNLHSHLWQNRESSGASGQRGAERDSRPAENHPHGCLWLWPRGARQGLWRPCPGFAGGRGMTCRWKIKSLQTYKLSDGQCAQWNWYKYKEIYTYMK